METSCHLVSCHTPNCCFVPLLQLGHVFDLNQEEARGLQWESKRFPVLTKYRCSGNGGLLWLTYRELLSENTMSCGGGPVYSSLSPRLPDSKRPLE